jgi:hypothetical protein
MPTMGLIKLPGAAVRTYAPSPPPIIPAGASFQKRRLSRFPNRQCDNPEAPVVNTSAACTLALAVAGGIPRLRRTVVEISPYAIPIAPSTIWAAKPMATNRRRSDTLGPKNRLKGGRERGECPTRRKTYRSSLLGWAMPTSIYVRANEIDIHFLREGRSHRLPPQLLFLRAHPERI